MGCGIHLHGNGGLECLDCGIAENTSPTLSWQPPVPCKNLAGTDYAHLETGSD